MSIYPDRTVSVLPRIPRCRAPRLCGGAPDDAGPKPSNGQISTLAARAVAISAELRATVALFVTTARSHRRALAAIGFMSADFPIFGRVLARRAPTYMWVPRGPGAGLAAESMTMTFADSAVDLDL
jgi:hypothetical protein